MKRFILMILLFYSFEVFSNEDLQKDKVRKLSKPKTNKNVFEGRLGYFFFTNTDAREIYHTGTPDVEIEFLHWFLRRYSVWTNFNYIWKSGKTQTFSTPTEIKITTLSLGVKEFFLIRKKLPQIYLGLGLTGALIWTKDQTDFLSGKIYRASPGIVGKFGFFYKGCFPYTVDLFFDYYYQPTWTKENNTLSESVVDLGGFRTGLGIGYSF